MNLNNVDLLYLMPSFMQNDSFTKALCKALNPYFQKLASATRLTFIYGRIDELDEDSINSLARQFHVDFFDYTLPLEKKRLLVKNSIRWHKIKGTKAAVQEVATTVFGRTKIQEWFEYDGKPYYFNVNIDITDQGASEENLKKLERLINAYKNTRSWVDYIHLFLTTHCKLYYACNLSCGEEITVYPYSISEISSKGKYNVGISQNISAENITLYPKKEVI